MRRSYLDHAAATPLTARAGKAYASALALFGNASAVHAEGRAAKEAVTAARTAIAATLRVMSDELVFTSGGTEANNIAIMGTVWTHAVTSTIEHASVLKAFALMEQHGRAVTYVAPGQDGVVRAESILKEVSAETGLVSLHHVNSESGTVQPIAEIGAALRKLPHKVALHTDAAQSVLWLEAAPHTLRADLVSYDAAKLGGPKGVGVLYRNFSIPLTAVSGGGTQERSIRPGTENVPAIVASAVAFEDAARGRKARAVKVAALRDYLTSEVRLQVPEAEIIGSMKKRVANNLFITIPGTDGDYLAVLMDAEGVAVTPRSACVGSGGGHSSIAAALVGQEKAQGTVRFTLGPATTKGDITHAVAALKKSLKVQLYPVR